jgi:hypothetical protein
LTGRGDYIQPSLKSIKLRKRLSALQSNDLLGDANGSKQTEAAHEQDEKHYYDANQKERQFKGHVKKIETSPALAFLPVYPQRHSYILSRIEDAQRQS